MPKAYEPRIVDSKWYAFWEKHNFFKVDPHSKKPAYCIVMPPPNVTGVLHMGHALGGTLQDILIRWKRMLGFEALWVPGTDHAGIATQTVVERHLKKTTGKHRKDFSREEFLGHVWKWKEENENTILSQLKQLGCSCDWSRLRFTMDEGCNTAVRTIFKKLFEEGLIYRGDYLVNWDPVAQTALADDEVEYEERQSFLWYFKYPYSDRSGYAIIATTRPETMLGDTAVAVSPKDERYTAKVGTTITLPLMNRQIPIVAHRNVDPLFGTGMVKITPAHDPNDNAMAKDLKLPLINILTPDGRINENGGEFQGMSREDARAAVVAKMKSLGLVEKIEPHTNRVGISYRSKATIEPYMSKQWFVKMSGGKTDFAQQLQQIVEKGETEIVPQTWTHTYFHWIKNLRDWCISRQLWWGHRIPIWYRKDNPKKMICYDGEGVPPEVAADPEEWTQDEDVLDTWFSSALWPFSTLGWPKKTDELNKFYPNSVLITGHDILFFWVARMLCMGKYTLDKAPFPQTVLHGLIYGKSYWRKNPDGGITYVDEKDRKEYDLGVKPVPKDVISKWEKLSKSKGNIIDPLDMIKEYGTDAMRMALCASATQAPQIDLDRRRFEEFKNFANKVWNGARFVFMNLESGAEGKLPALTAEELSLGLDEKLLSLEDKWILSSLNTINRDVNARLTAYTFDQAATVAYDFFWNEFCANYVEIAKPVLFGNKGTPQERANKQKILVIVLCNAIRLLHPMAPFITEELFQLLKERFAGVTLQAKADPYTRETIQALQSLACIVAPYPQIIRESDISSTVHDSFDLMNKVVYTIRNLRGEMQIPPGTSTDIYIVGRSQNRIAKSIQDNKEMITALVRTQNLTLSEVMPNIPFSSTGTIEELKIVIPMPEEILHKEVARLGKEQDRLTKVIALIRGQLSNEEFVSKAPVQLVDKQRALLTQSEKELEDLTRALSHKNEK